MRSTAIDGLAIHEGIVGSGGYGALVVGILVIEIAHAVGIEIIEMVEVRVVDVYVMPVAAAAVIPRMERLTPAERKPTVAAAKAKTDSKAAKKTNEGGTIVRPRIDRARAPAPVAAEIVPATIVVRRKTPRFIANPSPAPRGNVAPVAVAVGSPVRRNVVGNPDVADFGLLLPGTVVIEVAVADGVARNVAGRGGLIFLEVAFLGPTIEGIRFASSAGNVFHVGVGAADVGALASIQGISLSGGGYFALAADYGDSGVVAIFVYVNAESAGFADGEGEVGSIHFIVFALAEFPHAEIEVAFGQTHLNHVLIEIQERERGHAAEMNRGLSRLELRARVFVGPQFVADGYGTVLGGRAPIAGAAGLHRNGTIKIAEPGHARGRILGIVSAGFHSCVGGIVWRGEIGDVLLCLSPGHRGHQEQ